VGLAVAARRTLRSGVSGRRGEHRCVPAGRAVESSQVDCRIRLPFHGCRQCSPVRALLHQRGRTAAGEPAVDLLFPARDRDGRRSLATRQSVAGGSYWANPAGRRGPGTSASRVGRRSSLVLGPGARRSPFPPGRWCSRSVRYPVEPRLSRCFRRVRSSGRLGGCRRKARLGISVALGPGRRGGIFCHGHSADRTGSRSRRRRASGSGGPADRGTTGARPACNYPIQRLPAAALSQAPLACQETGRAGVHLKDGDSTVAETLPAPSLGIC
jgi:hypothetical protein